MKPHAALLVVLTCAPLSHADWLRLESPDAQLYTDAGERAGREALNRLAQLRELFVSKAPGLAAPRVFLFSSERDFRAIADGTRTAGFYRKGQGWELIALSAGEEALRVMTHEYVHLLLARAPADTHRFPAWLEEGLAEFYSPIEIRSGRATVGALLPAHRGVLAKARWLSPAELANARHPEEASRDGVFYAQSWALAHMLNLGEEYRAGFPAFAERLAGGAGVEEALAASFGKTFERMISDLRRYLDKMKPVQVDAEAVGRAEIKSSRLTALEASLLRAEVALRTEHPEVARGLLGEAQRANPGSAAVLAGLGMLAMFDNDRGKAREYLERATAAGGDASVWFEYALFERESGASAERVKALLEEAAKRDPGHTEARFLLGVRATDAGELEAAVRHLSEAVRAEPRRSSFWHALAFVLDRLGRRTEAATAAQRAVRTASTPEEQAMADALAVSLRPSE